MVLGTKLSLASLAVLALGAAGCSSTATSTPGTSTSNPAATTTATPGTAAPGDTSSAAAGLAAARAATQKNLQPPTTISLTQPLKTRPPAGKTFVWMKCDVSQCQDQADALKQATAAIGWRYMEIPYKSADPATLVSAMQQALNFKPAAVGMSAVPLATWQSVIPAYKAAGVPIVTEFLGHISYDSTLIGQVAGPAYLSGNGTILANWVTADSNGSAHVVFETVDDYVVNRDLNSGFEDTLKRNCPQCKLTILNNTIAQVIGGQAPQTIVAALEKDPTIHYVVSSDGPFIQGLPSALAAAGLKGIQIAGQSAAPENLSDVKSGIETAWTGFASNYGAWLMIDMVLRHIEGMTFNPDGDGGLPVQLLTKDVSFDISASYNRPADYAAQFKKLWLVG